MYYDADIESINTEVSNNNFGLLRRCEIQKSGIDISLVNNRDEKGIFLF
jgi:hypothetical protein